MSQTIPLAIRPQARRPGRFSNLLADSDTLIMNARRVRVLIHTVLRVVSGSMAHISL